MVNTRRAIKKKTPKRSSSRLWTNQSSTKSGTTRTNQPNQRLKRTNVHSQAKKINDETSLTVASQQDNNKQKKQILCHQCNVGFDTKKKLIDHTNDSPQCKHLLGYCYGCQTVFHSKTALSQHLIKNSSQQNCGVRHISAMMDLAKTSTMPIYLETNPRTQIHVKQSINSCNFNNTTNQNRLRMQSVQARMPGTFHYPGIMANGGETFDNFIDFDAGDNLVDNDEEDHDLQIQITTEANDSVSVYQKNHFEDLIIRMKKIKAIREQLTWGNEITAGLELEHILHKSGASLGLFDNVMAWATENKSYLPDRTRHLSRYRLYNICKQKLYGNDKEKSPQYKVSANEPCIVSTKLPSQRTINVPKFSFKYHLTSLLSNEDLMKPENLIYEPTPTDPFHIPRDNERYGDVHHTEWWDDTTDMLINNPTKELLCPLILYLDALVVDAYGNLSLEPVTFTLGIFNRALRHMAKAWKTLGFIEDLDKLFGANQINADEKADDYHAILAIILADIKEIQKAGGIDWVFEINGTKHKRRLKIPIMFIIGDCKGHDVLCARVASHQAHYLCRDCNCSKESGDDPMVVCVFHKQSVIEKLSKKECKAISFRKLIVNAFSGVCFGANPYGINVATPPEALHAIQLGLCIRLVESLISELPKSAQEELDNMVAAISSKFHRQSDREMPDLKPFKSGLSNTSRLTAKQKYARVFVIYLALNTKSFAQKVTSTKYPLGNKKGNKCQFPKEKYRKTLRIFEQVLLFYRWVVKADHKRSDFVNKSESRAARRLRLFARDYKYAAPRHAGLKLKIPKFHQILHWWFYIMLFGSAMNFDSGRTESIAGENAKDHGKNTQKRSKNFNEQTAHRLHEKTIFDEARY